MVLYRKGLHPEFFGIQGRQRIVHGEYEFEAWIFAGGHVLQFQHGGVCLTELVTERLDGLPDSGQMNCLPCAGEKDHEEILADRVNFVTSIQTETLSDHLYLATWDEMIEHAKENRSLIQSWEDEAERQNLSIVDLQRYRDEVHVQCYHLRSDCSLVLRTQSIFTAMGDPLDIEPSPSKKQ